MFNSSPITSWEGAEAIFSYADSPLGMAVCFWIMTAMLIVCSLGQNRTEMTHSGQHMLHASLE